jgi:hypothetical protein
VVQRYRIGLRPVRQHLEQVPLRTIMLPTCSNVAGLQHDNDGRWTPSGNRAGHDSTSGPGGGAATPAPDRCLFDKDQAASLDEAVHSVDPEHLGGCREADLDRGRFVGRRLW